MTVVVHSLLIGSFALGTGMNHARPPQTEGFQSTAHSADATEFVSTFLVLTDHTISTPDQDTDSAYGTALKETKEAAKALEESLITSTDSGAPPQIASVEEAVDTHAPTEEVMGDGAG